MTIERVLCISEVQIKNPAVILNENLWSFSNTLDNHSKSTRSLNHAMVDSCDVISNFFPTEHTITCGYAVSDTDIIK